MKIETNMPGGIHDLIKYPSIERQVFDICVTQFKVVNHSITHSGFAINLDGMSCPLEVKKKGVRISVLPSEDFRFGEGEYPFVTLAYNVDVKDKLLKFFDKVRKINDLEDRAAKILKDHDAIDQTALSKFLNRELETDVVQVSFWKDNLFSGMPIAFYIHPKDDPPAGGVMVCWDNGKLVPFWNGSTKRRTHCHEQPELIEKAIGDMRTQDQRRSGYKSDLAHMKKKIAAAEAVQARVDAFDPSKSKPFMALLAVREKANALVEEFNAIPKVTK